MPEHVLPFGLDLRPEWRGEQGLERRNVDADECALFLQNAGDVDSSADEVGVPMQVDDVVEVARSAAFGECPQLLAEEFRDRVRQHTADWKRLIAVVVADLPDHWL